MRILLSLLFIVLANDVYATHLIGGELSYTQIPGNDTLYIVTFKYYRDCGDVTQSSSSEPSSISLCIYNSCNSQLITANLPKIMGQIATNPVGNNGSEIYNPCNGQTTCTNINSTVHGYRQWWYQDTISLPFACNSWRIEVAMCCRTGLAYNYGPASPSSYYFYVETKIDNSVFNYNNSAVFQYDSTIDKLPIPQVQVNLPYIHTGGAIDPDGDSLVFETIYPMNNTACSGGTPTNILKSIYNISDSAGNPFNTNNSYFLDKHTGHYTFVPGLVGYAGLAQKISEYRNGQLIGSVMRDFCIVNSTGGNYSMDSTHVCPGDSYTFPNMVTVNNLQTDTFMYNYFTSSQGCDSIILSMVDVVNFVDTMIQNGNVLTSLEIDSTTTFQWITCTPLSVLIGDTTNTLVVLQPGEYAVVMSKYGCSDTSDCVLISTIPTSNTDIVTHDFSISPNPTKDKLQLNLVKPLSKNETINVYDAIGKKVISVPVNDHNLQFTINVESLPSGIYLIKLGNVVKRFVKE